MKSQILKVLVFVLCFATLFSLVACNGGQGSTVEETTEDVTNTDETTLADDETTEEESETEFVTSDMTVEESEGVANVTTAKGLAYTASGYDSINGSSFVFRTKLELGFEDGTFGEKFNRMTLKYRANGPVRIYVTYANHIGEDVVADFFVEEGEGYFSGLILDYISKRLATNITKITVEPCKDKKVSFALYDLETEEISCYVGSYGNTKVYINNTRFKLGVDIGWGGAICYIEDLKSNIPGLSNLVNKADEGRLIQQSYYGTPAIPGVYEPGEFNNAKWNYNPVQGGDQYGNDSRIIDIEVTDTSFYIKAQPQDWSLNGAITPSYMENWYVLHDDRIEVKNRFVDFSGWTHPMTSQELPAFYTVSYLNTFVWYDGSEPWTNGELSTRGNLNFWGDPQYAADCRFPLKKSNTETWCAWINSANNYGMGVFVPNTDVYSAGRFAYDGTMDPDSGACGYVAPIKNIKLVSYEALEYSYLITTGSVEEIRATFTKYKDFTDNASLDKNSTSMRVPDGNVDLSMMDFSKSQYADIFTNHHSTTTEYDPDEKALKCTVTGDDAYAAIEFGTTDTVYNAGDYATIEIVYMIPTSNSAANYVMELFLSTGSTASAVGGKSVTGQLIADGEYHTLTLDVASLSFWSGKINQIRFDYFSGAAVDDVIFVKSIQLK